MTTESQIEGSSPRENLGLWIGVLGAPVAWLLQLQVSYMLVPWACKTGRHFVLHLSTLVFLVLAAAAALPAWRIWRAAGGGSDADRESSGHGRRQFMGLLGLWLTALFVLLIIAQGIPSFILNPCQD